MLPGLGNGWMKDGLAAVFFDLDGTLRTHQPSYVEAFYDFVRQLNPGLHFDAARRRSFFRWTHYYWAQSPELQQDAAEFPERDQAFWLHYTRRSLQAIGLPPEIAAELAPAVSAYMQEEHQGVDVLLPGANETLQTLQQAGLRLALLTNRTQLERSYLQELNLHSGFEVILAAGEVASYKPEPGIFLAALQRMSLAACQVVYVGDNYYADVVGARRAGIQPVLFDPQQVFEQVDCPVISDLGELPGLLNLSEDQPESEGQQRSAD